MKKLILTLSAVAMATAMTSCNGDKTGYSHDPALVHATVSVDGDYHTTRSTGVTAAQEENVKNLQIFVFSENGEKEFYVNAGSSKTGEIVVEEGKKNIVALVNAPAMESITSKSSLYSQTSKLSDNSLGSLVMTGEAEVVIQSGGNITIQVTRLISKVTIKKISSAFKSSTYSSKEFKINSIYLINVAGDNTYAGTSQPTIWYNKLYNGTNDSNAGSFALLSDPVGKVLAYQSSYSVEHSFFCYPNPTSDESFESTWCPRHTMLVVDALLDGKQTYYPVELPVIGRNKSIIIDELIITRKGSDYPYVPVPDGTCNVSVEVVDWDVILNYTETI